jgi:hypothetical protein
VPDYDDIAVEPLQPEPLQLIRRAKILSDIDLHALLAWRCLPACALHAP